MCKKIKRYPINGTFELTGRCNLSCKMCLVRVDQRKIQELVLRERTADEWIHMAEQVEKAGTLGLLLTGGEVMLRSDFCEIYEAISKMGFVLTVFTNATMINQRIMECFQRFPPHKIGVTMYGASNKTYEKLCSCEDGYDRFIDGVNQLSVLPSMLDIRTTIVQDNLSDLAAMKEFVRNKFDGKNQLYISRTVFNSIRDGICDPKRVRILPEQNVSLVYPWLENMKENLSQEQKNNLNKEISKLHPLRHQMPMKGNYLFSNCNAGIDEYTISWSGRMYACGLATEGFTQPFEEGFLSAWERLPEQYPHSKVNQKCLQCEYSFVCDSCPANRMAETGDWFGIPEYACQEAKYVYDILADLNIN